MGKIILGAVLAVFGGIITQIIMVKWADKRTINTLKILLVDIIDQINQVIDNLKLAYDKTNIAWFDYLTQLTSIKAIFDRNREWLCRIKDDELRKEINEYFDKIMLFEMNARACENMKINMPQNAPYAAGKLKEEIAKAMATKESSKILKDHLKSIK